MNQIKELNNEEMIEIKEQLNEIIDGFVVDEWNATVNTHWIAEQYLAKYETGLNGATIEYILSQVEEESDLDD